MRKAEQARKWFIQTALSYLGTPYIWGGDDPSGFDCSGFVIECLQSIGVLPAEYDNTANGLMQFFNEQGAARPDEGVLAFYVNSDGKTTHVVICLDEWFQIGASGGTSRTNNAQESWRDNAYVMIRPIPKQRRIRYADPFRRILPIWQ